MLGHIIFSYQDNGEVIFKQSDVIFENVTGELMVDPVLKFVKNNTTAQMLQKAKACGYKAYTKENYNDLFPLKDDLYLIINMINNSVDFFAKHKPLFENEDVFELPETKLNVLRKIGSYSFKEGGKGFARNVSFKKDFEQVLGEMNYIRWINETARRISVNYEGRCEISIGDPYNRLPKVTKDYLARLGYEPEKSYYDGWKFVKKIEGVDKDLSFEMKDKLLKKEYKLLRVDRTYEDLEEYLNHVDLLTMTQWSNDLFMKTGESILRSKQKVYQLLEDGSHSDWLCDFYGYIVTKKEVEEMYTNLPLKTLKTLCVAYSPLHDDNYQYIIVDGYVLDIDDIRTFDNRLSLKDGQIEKIINSIQYIDDPKLARLVNDYVVMKEFKQSHLYYDCKS